MTRLTSKPLYNFVLSASICIAATYEAVASDSVGVLSNKCYLNSEQLSVKAENADLEHLSSDIAKQFTLDAEKKIHLRCSVKNPNGLKSRWEISSVCQTEHQVANITWHSNGEIRFSCSAE